MDKSDIVIGSEWRNIVGGYHVIVTDIRDVYVMYLVRGCNGMTTIEAFLNNYRKIS